LIALLLGRLISGPELALLLLPIIIIIIIIIIGAGLHLDSVANVVGPVLLVQDQPSK
jgi:hypothetical protein